jgi:hypothetical protein
MNTIKDKWLLAQLGLATNEHACPAEWPGN